MPNPFKTARFGGAAGAALGPKPKAAAPVAGAMAGGMGGGTAQQQDMRITNPGGVRGGLAGGSGYAPVKPARNGGMGMPAKPAGPSAEDLKMQNAQLVRGMFNPRLAESGAGPALAPGTHPSGVIKENNRKIAAMGPAKKPVAAKQPMPAKPKITSTPGGYRTVTNYSNTGDVKVLSRTKLPPKLQSKTGQIPF